MTTATQRPANTWRAQMADQFQKECLNCMGDGCTGCRPVTPGFKVGHERLPNIAPQVLAGAKHVHTFAEGEEPREMLVHNNVLFVATNKMVYCLNEAGKLEPLSVMPNA